MHGQCQTPGAKRTILVVVLLALCMAVVPVFAQNLDGFSQPVTFKVTNATTGNPGAVERLTIDYMTARADNLVDARPSGAMFTIPAVPLRDEGQYVVTAWWQGVPYWFRFRGRAMAADTLSLNVFNTTEDLKDVAVTGLNLVALRQGGTIKLEYLLEIDNTTSPQQTILGPDYTLTLAVPGGASDINATYSRGPDPTPITTTAIGGEKLGLAVPLTSGKNTVHLECRVPWTDGLAMPVGLNVPVQTWSFLLSPDWLQVAAMGLESDPAAGFKGYRRFRGPALEADRPFAMRLSGDEGHTGSSGQVFTTGVDSSGPVAGDQLPEPTSVSGGIPLRLVLVLALVALILLFVAKRRARS